MKLADAAKLVGIETPKVFSGPSAAQPAEPGTIAPKKVLLSWESTPVFIYKTMKPRMRKTFAIIGITVGLLLLLMQEFWLILAVASIFFINHVLSKTPQQSFDYEISNRGVGISSEEFYWDNMENYFLTTGSGEERFAIDLKTGFPSRIYLSFHHKDKEKINELLAKYVPYLQEEPLTAVDKVYNSILDKFDLEEKK